MISWIVGVVFKLAIFFGIMTAGVLFVDHITVKEAKDGKSK